MPICHGWLSKHEMCRLGMEWNGPFPTSNFPDIELYLPRPSPIPIGQSHCYHKLIHFFITNCWFMCRYEMCERWTCLLGVFIVASIFILHPSDQIQYLSYSYCSLIDLYLVLYKKMGSNSRILLNSFNNFYHKINLNKK